MERMLGFLAVGGGVDCRLRSGVRSGLPACFRNGAVHARNVRKMRVLVRASADVSAVADDQKQLPWATARASHILLETEDMATACLETLKEQPQAFEEMAKSLSQCPSSSRGGDLGWFSPGMMVKEFESAAFEGEVGSLTKVKTQFGWHIIRVDGKGKVSPEISAKEFIRRYTNPEERAQLQLVDVRDKAEVEKFSLDGFYNLPNMEPSKLQEALEDGSLGLDKEKETIVICQSGKRSDHFAKYLAQQGFNSTRSLVGGLQAYALQLVEDDDDF